MRQLKIGFIFLFILSAGLVFSPDIVHAQDGQAWAMLGLVNDARADQGASPLAMNSRLVSAAQRHSDDMANGDFMSHTGSDGSRFWERIADAGYSMTTGAENVLYRFNLSAPGAFQQWRDSPPHNTNVMNDDYQEIGIAWAQSGSGKYYYTMVLAARSDFVVPTAAPPTAIPTTSVPPTTAPPTSVPPTVIPPTAIPPTSAPPTAIPPTAIPPTVIPPTAIPPTVIPPTAIPPTVIPPTAVPPMVVPSLTIPATVERVTAVPSTDFPPATILPTASSTVAPSTGVPPTTIPPTNVALTVTPPPVFNPTPAFTILDRTQDPEQPRQSLRQIISEWLAAGAVVFREEASPASATPKAIPPTTAPPVATPFPTATTEPMVADLRLEYNYDSFTLVNSAGKPLFIDGLSFESRSGAMSITQWDTEYLSASLDSFPDKGCLQAWSLNEENVLRPPDSCQIRHAWAAVGDVQMFWRNADIFTVYHYGEGVVACLVSAGYCDVDLTARLAVAAPVPAATHAPVDVPPPPQENPPPFSGGGGGVRLIYTSEYVALLNISGGNLDLTGLGFSSITGTLDIGRWDTEYLSRPLYAFPTGDCLQAWSVSVGSQPDKPEECNLRHAWISLGDEYLFWRGTDFFTVSRYGTVLQTCPVNAGVCDFNLP